MAGFFLFESRGPQQTSGVRACKEEGDCVGFEPPVEGFYKFVLVREWVPIGV